MTTHATTTKLNQAAGKTTAAPFYIFQVKSLHCEWRQRVVKGAKLVTGGYFAVYCAHFA